MKKLRAFFFVIFMTSVFAGATFSLNAATNQPTLFEGNHFSVASNTLVLKIDPPASGTYHLQSDPSVTIQVQFTDEGKLVEFKSNRLVETVFVKGGPNGYVYQSKSLNDFGLRAPNNNGGKQPQISHVNFYFSPSQTATSTAATATPSSTNAIATNAATAFPTNSSGNSSKVGIVSATNPPTVVSNISYSTVKSSNESTSSNTASTLPNSGENTPWIFVIIGLTISIVGMIILNGYRKFKTMY